MTLFGGFQERREKKALEHYLVAPSIDATEIEELKKACANARGLLYDVLKSAPEGDKRFRALIGLQTLGINEEMLPSILAALRDEDDFVQEAAAKLLGHLKHLAPVAVPALITAYREHPASRPIVLQILSEYGPEAHRAAPMLLEGLRKPVEALGVAQCLAHIGCEEVDPIDRGMVDVLSDRKDVEKLRALGPGFQARLEVFLESCVPWRTVDAVPAWRRALEAYADLGVRPAEAVARLLNELVQYSDWKLRGEVGAQFLEMSRAKMIAEKLVQRT